MAEATVLRGIESYGAELVVHTPKILSFSDDSFLIAEIVDRGNIAKFLPIIDILFVEVGCCCMVTIEKAEVIKYTGGKK